MSLFFYKTRQFGLDYLYNIKMIQYKVAWKILKYKPKLLGFKYPTHFRRFQRSIKDR